MRRAALVLAAWTAVVSLSCGGSSKRAGTPACVHNSDCVSGLICALGYCVKQCNTSVDCPNNARCVIVGDASADGGTGARHTACQAPETVVCHYTSDCKQPLVCGIDLQCRDQCHAATDCPMGQVCTAQSHLCADPSIDKDYDPVTMDFRTADGGLHGDGGGHAGASGHGDGGVDDRDGSRGDGAASKGDGSATQRDGSTDAPLPPPSCAPGLAGFHPSNLPVGFKLPSGLTTFTQTSNGTFDTDALTFSTGADAGQWTAMAVTMPGNNEAALVVFDSYTLAAGATLSITGRRPLIVAAAGKLQIDGNIGAVRSVTNGWYGGGPPAPGTPMRAGLCALDVLAGGGGAGNGNNVSGYGSGGGGYCGLGGQGSALPDGGTPAPGGTAYGNPQLIPLAGGASGGSTNAADTTNHGGGAIELVAGTSIAIGDTAIINLGGGGTDPGYGVGGGSGGAILLEAPTVTVRGILAVNGGSGSTSGTGGGQNGLPSDQPAIGAGGGKYGGNGSAGTAINGHDATLPENSTYSAGGGGGAGRIRINTGCGGALSLSSGAQISPATSTSCTSMGALK